VAAVLANAIVKRCAEIIQSPVADAVLFVRCDVGRVDHAHRAVDRTATGEGLAALRSVAGHTVRCPHDIFAGALRGLVIGGKLGHRAGFLDRHEDERQKRHDAEDDEHEDGAKKGFHRRSPYASGRGLGR
jgi:hypothetical protein